MLIIIKLNFKKALVASIKESKKGILDKKLENSKYITKTIGKNKSVGR